MNAFSDEVVANPKSTICCEPDIVPDGNGSCGAYDADTAFCACDELTAKLENDELTAVIPVSP